MRRYVTVRQIARIGAAALLLRFGARVPAANLALFWVLPSLLRRARAAACALTAALTARQRLFSVYCRHSLTQPARTAARCSCSSSAPSCRTARRRREARHTQTGTALAAHALATRFPS
jgi:hypothetical protein